MQPQYVHAIATGGGQAVLTEAEPEEVATERPELDEVALVVESMLEPMEVQRLRNHRAHALGRGGGGKRRSVRADLGVVRAEVRQVCVAESIAARTLWMRLAERVVVQEDGPGADAERACGRVMAEVREHIGLLSQRADRRLQDPALVAVRVRLDDDDAAFYELDLARPLVLQYCPPVL